MSESAAAPAAGGESAAPPSPQDAMIEEVGSLAVADEETQEVSDAVAEEEGSLVDELVAEGESSSEEEVQEQIKELKKLLKIKVDGEEIEEEIDFNNEEDLKKKLQKARAFDKKAQEAATVRKQAESIIQMLKENPVELLKRAGHDLDEMAYNHLNNVVEESKKSPEQQELEKRAAREKELEEKLQKLEEEKTNSENERLKNQEAANIQKQIIDSLGNTETILSVEDPEVIGDIARAMYRAMEAGNPNVEVKDVIQVVEKRYVDKLLKRMDLMDDKALETVFKKPLDRLRKKRVSKKKAETKTAKQLAKETGDGKPTEPEKPAEPVRMKDFFTKW